MSGEEIKSPMPRSEVQKLLDSLLKKIPKVEFREMIVERGGTADKISRQQYQVCAVDKLLEIANKNEWGLAKSGEFVYAYNGQYWMLLDKHEFQTFLAKAAYKMGVPKIEAKQYQFQEQLVKQFFASANLSAPIRGRDRVLINLKNGTYEITPFDNCLRAFHRADFLTYQLPFQYDPNATAPIFRAYLDKVLPEKESQDVLAEFVGYVFAKGLKLEKCLLLYGSGANGKSVFFDIINALLGEENVSNFSLSNLSEEHNRALIANKLLNYGSEIRANIESDIFKQLASGEAIQCRLKYGNSFTIRDYARLIFNCNELPNHVEQTEAFFRRFIIVPFGVRIPEEERDPGLAMNIIGSELSGIFNWVLDGVDRLLKNTSFSRSETINLAVKEYKEQSDNVHLFLSEGIYIKSDKFTLLKFVYDDYRAFCKDCGYNPLNIRNFRRRLDALGHVSSRRGSGTGYYLGRSTT